MRVKSLNYLKISYFNQNFDFYDYYTINILIFFITNYFKLNSIREADDRFQFLLAYTTALNDINKLKDLNETLSTKEATTTTLEMDRVETFLVNDKHLTLDQIKEYANSEKSEKQIKINNDREFKSEELMKKLRSKDCQVLY